MIRTYVRPFLVDAAYVPMKAGSFMMGTTSSEKNRSSDEGPVNVTLSKAFEIGATEITQLQWVVVMGSNPSYFKEEKYCKDSYAEINGVAICADLPVERVSWNEIQDFIAEYNKRAKDAYTYRLPTEAEWEYAARAGTQTAYAFGEDVSKLKDYAWYYENSENQSHSVATKAANAWGLYDMHGNVWEWVNDWYEGQLKGGTDPKGPQSGSFRVIRGGGWFNGASYLRSGFRGNVGPGERINFVGFRLVRTAK